MATPQDNILSTIQNQRDQATPAGMPPSPDATASAGMSDTSAPPMASPMSTPEPKMGNREAAMINIGMAMDLLEQSLPAIGSESEEGRKLLAAIRSMTDVIGGKRNKTGELQQSEILQMLQTLPQAGGATPEAKAMQQAPMISGMGAAPAPTPPMPMPGATAAPATPM